MKALSVKQPWANYIAAGRKPIETRTWQTSYRGDLLICSSKNPPIQPAGVALATAVLVDCRRFGADDAAKALTDFQPGLYAWVLDDVKRIAGPFPVRGRLQIFEVQMPPGFWERHDWCAQCHGRRFPTVITTNPGKYEPGTCTVCRGQRQEAP